MRIFGAGVPAMTSTSAVRPTNPTRPATGRDAGIVHPLQFLTHSDREPIARTTGQRFDSTADPAAFAFTLKIAVLRQSGHLAPGQHVSAILLKDLSRPRP